jgi:2-(1,2-epoxy-1,2-dihydrophenyl)acetyl-CoA isomerase
MTKALELMLTGQKVTANEALALGMVNQVVADTNLAVTVQQMAQMFLNAPTKTIGLIKQAVNFAATSTLEAAMKNEAALQNDAYPARKGPYSVRDLSGADPDNSRSIPRL